jgi:hypothetical protein
MKGGGKGCPARALQMEDGITVHKSLRDIWEFVHGKLDQVQAACRCSAVALCIRKQPSLLTLQPNPSFQPLAGGAEWRVGCEDQGKQYLRKM